MSAELVAKYEEHLALVRNLADNSIRGYVSDLESFLAHIAKLGITEFSELQITHIRSWLANLQSTGISRATLARRIVSIRAFTYWAASQGWIPSDIGSDLAIPKAHKTLPEVLNHSQTQIVLDAIVTKAGEDPKPINIRDLAIIEVLYASGIRVSEICGLNIRDIDWERNTLLVLGKGDKERVVPIGSPALAAVKNWISAGRPEFANTNSGDAVFLGARGKRIDQRTVREVVYDAMEAIGSHMSPHGLRTVQEILGHSSLATTQIYTHVSPERLKSAYEQAHPRA